MSVSACAKIPFAEFRRQMLGEVECLLWTWGKREAFGTTCEEPVVQRRTHAIARERHPKHIFKCLSTSCHKRRGPDQSHQALARAFSSLFGVSGHTVFGKRCARPLIKVSTLRYTMSRFAGLYSA